MKKHRLISFIKNNYLYFLFVLIHFLLNIFLFKKAYTLNSIEKNNTKYFVLFFSLTFIELLYLVIINIKCKNKYPIEKLFLILIIPIGLMYMLFLPFGQVPDENTHYARIYSISDGHLVSEVAKDGYTYALMPKNVVSTFSYSKNKKYALVRNHILDSNSKENTYSIFTNMALYNFIVYIPQVTGVLIGRLLHLPYLIVMYLARLFNLMSFVFLMYQSIKRIPYLKKYILFISLLPIIVQEAASFSSDALTISISFFLISYILYLKEKKEFLTKKEYLILFISSIICSMSKIVYIPIILLAYILPKDLFKSKKDKIIKISIMILICIIINGGWTLYATRYLIEYNAGVDSKAQLKYILTHPINYIYNILKTMVIFGPGFIYQAYGRKLGLLDVDVGRYYPIGAVLMTIYLSITNRFKEKKNSIIEGVMYLLVPLAIVGLIFTSLYIQWTPVSKDIIDGVQGRYFIPLLLFIPLIFMRINKSKDNRIMNEKNDLKYIISFIVFENINAIAFIIFANL